MGEPTAAAPEKKGCLGKYWVWLLGCGCLAALLFIVLIVCAIIFIPPRMMKSSDAYKMALVKVQNDFRVEEDLGRPIKEGFFVSGDVSVNNGSGKANLNFPVSGPKGEGKVEVQATRSGGAWHMDKLIVRVEGKRDIDLSDFPEPERTTPMWYH